VPNSAAAVPNSAAAVPDSAAAVPNSAAAVPDSAAAVPDSAAAVPDSAAAVPNSAAAVPISAAAVPISDIHATIPVVLSGESTVAGIIQSVSGATPTVVPRLPLLPSLTSIAESPSSDGTPVGLHSHTGMHSPGTESISPELEEIDLDGM